MKTLRSPEGCAWDREQTHASLRGALIEECHEVIEAIDEEDDQLLREELGDLLLHVVFHAQMAAEREAFTWDDVCRTVMHKMIARHPHVFRPFPTGERSESKSSASSPKEILQQWETLKSHEKRERESILDGIPNTLPALGRAQKIQSKAARVGFDWPDAKGAREKIEEELAECDNAQKKKEDLEEEIGDLLFSVVNWARKSDIDAESALLRANRKFEKRFRLMEKDGLEGKGLKELEESWQKAKTTLKEYT